MENDEILIIFRPKPIKRFSEWTLEERDALINFKFSEADEEAFKEFDL